MKKRRAIILGFLLIACLCLGVGYAAFSDTLTVRGTVASNANQENFKMVFTEAVTENESDADKCTLTLDNSGLVVAFDIKATTLTAKGQSITAVFTIKNDSPSDLTAYVSKTFDIVNNDTTNYEITAEWDSSVTIPDGQTYFTLASGATAIFKVTVELLNTPVDAAIADKVFTVKVNASTEQPSA